jgi:hypothetical protein
MKPDGRHAEPRTTRCGLLQAAGLGIVGMTGLELAGTPPASAAQAQKAPALRPLNRFGRMVHEFFVGHARAASWASCHPP